MPTEQARFLIIETGRPLPTMNRRRGFDHWICVAARLPPAVAVTCSVAAGQPLPAAEAFAGVIITGSGAMVSERLHWSEASADWLRRFRPLKIPLLGICYGHQLLAHAFGGEVGYHPAGREIGTVEVELALQADGDRLFSGFPSRFRAQTTHLQSVLRAPDDALILARSAHEPCNAMRVDGHLWGVQFHPEFSTRHIKGYIGARQQAIRAEGGDPQLLLQAVRPAPWSRRVLQRFVALARSRDCGA